MHFLKSMSQSHIPYQETGYFSKLIIDYLNEKKSLQNLYNRFPKIENFKDQILEKKQSFSTESRNILVDELRIQNQQIALSDISKSNIDLLQNLNTFTITTGHQLCLFTGPLYFIYKIVSTIKLCKELKVKYPDYHFVPIYWMASEDHDFDEVNHFWFKNKKISWQQNNAGAVGEIPTQSLEETFLYFSSVIGAGTNAEKLKKIFEKSYLEHSNLANATRFLVNELFGNQGLVILDGNSKALKNRFVPYLKKEIEEQISYKKVSETISNFQYDIQVNPREINLFYLDKNSRERIVFENDSYKINNTEIVFSEKEIVKEIDNFPEKFSPNVILRPMYQEIVLPNLCYIGGGGEIAYWLELKTMFKAFQIPFPMLLLRNSVLVVSEKQQNKIEKLKLSWRDLFLKNRELVDKRTKEITTVKFDFSQQKQFLQKQFQDLQNIVSQTDKSFANAVKAQEVKQIKGLENLEKRLLKAEQKKHAEVLERISAVQNELFPNGKLQERIVNFSEFYVEYGQHFFDVLFEKLKPLEQNFMVIVY